MRRALEESHPGLYRYSTKTEMDHWFDTQRTKLNRVMKGASWWSRPRCWP